MKQKSLFISLTALFFFALFGWRAVSAQETGSLSGGVYNDLDGDGICFEEDDPGEAGITLELIDPEDGEAIRLTTDSEGLFTQADAAQGDWEVTVVPGTGWRITSQQTRQVFLSEDEELDVEEIVFCITRETAGSISGFVYRELDEDGICLPGDATGQPDIPLQLVFRDNDTTVNLATESNGSYRLASAAEGTWQVTVNPGTGWRVTSPQTRQVLVSADNANVEGVDFCLFEVPAPAGGGQPVLPESGAAVSPGILLILGSGAFFLIAGILLYTRSSKERP